MTSYDEGNASGAAKVYILPSVLVSISPTRFQQILQQLPKVDFIVAFYNGNLTLGEVSEEPPLPTGVCSETIKLNPLTLQLIRRTASY